MVTAEQIYEQLAQLAPVDMKMDFDNVGFLVGFSENPINQVLVSLDITDDVISEAIAWGAGLIVSHHPLFFSLKSVTDGDRTGRKIVRMISHGVSAICMHTNLDAAIGGVNDALAAKAGIVKGQLLSEDGYRNGGEAFSYGRFGLIEKELELSEYLELIKKNLNANGLRYYDAGRKVHQVAVVGGSGGGELHSAIARGCDTMLTADIKYDVFLEAKESAINLIDGDHFCTENTVTPVLCAYIQDHFPELMVKLSSQHAQTAQFF